MAFPPILQSQQVVTALFLLLWAAAVTVCLFAWARNPIQQLQHPAVVLSAILTVTGMLLAWYLMVMGYPLSARLAWTLAFLLLLLHIGLAFALAHGWSHTAAVQHVREVGGFGSGILVNYLFALVWMIDVLWWWRDPSNYASRTRGTTWCIHGFLLFVVVNAAVVFGPPQRRGITGAALLGLGACWLWTVRPFHTSTTTER